VILCHVIGRRPASAFNDTAIPRLWRVNPPLRVWGHEQVQAAPQCHGRSVAHRVVVDAQRCRSRRIPRAPRDQEVVHNATSNQDAKSKQEFKWR